MASVEKFAASAAVNQIRHIERTIQHPSDPAHIDRTKRTQNYYLSPDKGMTSYDYYKHRRAELHCLNRGDVKPLAGWVITAPDNLSPDNYESFFASCYDYLCEQFGEDNCVSAVVHMDEATPHLHFLFIPVVHTDKFPQGKISAKECITKSVLRNFHPGLQKHLDRNGINAQVYTGVTARQGGNKTIRQLKQERQHTFEHQQQYNRGLF